MNDEILPLPWCSRRPRGAAPGANGARRASAAPRRAARPPSASATPTDAALRLLQARGLVLLARNLACRHGEIDLAMRDGAVLVRRGPRPPRRALRRRGGQHRRG